MSIKNKIMMVIVILVLLSVLIFIFWPTKPVVIEKKIIKTIPASVVIIPTQDLTQTKSTTGAMLTVLPDDQYKETTLIYLLRQKCPMKNEYFEIKYDYGVDKFIVTIPTVNMETFLQWKKDTGYNFITDQFWQIKIND